MALLNQSIDYSPYALMALGSGLLQGSMPGQNLASGLSAGLQGMTPYLVEGARARQEQAKQQALYEGLQPILGQPARTIQSPAFQSGANMQPATGLAASQPELAGLLGAYAQTDPQAVAGLLSKQMMPEQQTPTSAMQNLTAMGLQPGTPEFTAAMQQYLFKPQTQINMGEKLPTGYMWRDPSDTRAGVIPIPGGPAEKRAGETAGKEAMITTSQQLLPTIDSLLFGGSDVLGGEVNRSVLGAAAIEPYIPGFIVPEANALNNAYEYGIQAITRIETGAAMPANEIQNTRRRFQPSVGDTDDVIRQKRLAYELFLNNAKKYLDPNAPETGNWSVDVGSAMLDAKKALNKSGNKIGRFVVEEE